MNTMDISQPIDSILDTQNAPFANMPDVSAEPVELPFDIKENHVEVEDQGDQEDSQEEEYQEEGEIPTRKVGTERIEAIHFKRYGTNIEIRETTEEYVQKVTFVNTKKEDSIEVILYSVGNLPMIHLNDVDIPLADFLQFKYIEKVDETTSVVNYGNNEYITLPTMSNDLLIALLTYLGVKSEDMKQKEEVYTYTFHANLSISTLFFLCGFIYMYYLVKGWIAIGNQK